MKQEFAYKLLDQTAQVALGEKLGIFFPSPPQRCNVCQVPFSYEKYFIDGRLKEQRLSGFFCASCFLAHGEGIGWEQGKLYLNQGKEVWLQVGGFHPEDVYPVKSTSPEPESSPLSFDNLYSLDEEKNTRDE
ncbi:MAG: hypothetical protein ACEPOZ_14630 [Marinifilaceae bacterium]